MQMSVQLGPFIRQTLIEVCYNPLYLLRVEHVQRMHKGIREYEIAEADE